MIRERRHAVAPRTSSGRPLDSAIRAFMEGRFGVDLSAVTIHFDAEAAAWARRLDARAFTRGAHIFFGDGEYRPETPRGRRLLAHELVHTIQQSQVAGFDWGAKLEVGDPCSWFEVEAETIASEVLRSGRVSPITPDPSGIVRRVITFLPNTAKITLSNSGAVAAVTPTTDGRRLVCNLTKGFNADDPTNNGDAFEATGSVDALVDTPAELAAMQSGAFRFAFVQISRMNFSGIFWAGRKSSEGSVGMVISAPPAWPANRLVSLDSQSAISPFISPTRPIITDKPQGGKTLVQVTDIKMGDHPVVGGPIKLPNKAKVTENFIFQIKERTEYFSTLAVKDASGKLNPLAHFKWEVNYDATILWRGGNPTSSQKGAITFDTPVLGGPADSAINSLLATPHPPFTNDLHTDANATSVHGGNPANFSQNPRWFSTVPQDFWQ